MEGVGIGRDDDIHTARAYNRVHALDEAFWDGYKALLESIRPVKPPAPRRRRHSTMSAVSVDGDDTYLDQPVSHVVATFPDYLAARGKLLTLKLASWWALRLKGDPRAAVDRFQVTRALQGFETVLEPSATDVSYYAWRRHLLRSKFEERRAACEDEELRRLAAEAMQRAMLAEQAERRRHLEMEEAALAAEAAEEETDDRGWAGDVALEELYAPRGLTYSVGLRFCVTANAAPPPPGAPRKPGAGIGLLSPAAKRTSTGAVQAVACLQFMPDSNDHFAVGFDDGTVALCAATAGTHWCLLTGHTASVTSLDWGGGGAYLLTASVDRTARLWAVSSPPEGTIPDGGISKAAPPPTTGSATCVRIVYRENPITHALFFPMNPNLFVVGEVVDASSSSASAARPAWRQNVMRHGGRLLNRFSRKGLLATLNVSTGKVVDTFKLGSQIASMRFTANGRQLYVADTAGLVHVYNTESNFQKQSSQPFSGHKTVFGRTPARSLLVHDDPTRRRGSLHSRHASRRPVGLRQRVAGMLRRRFRSPEAVFFTNLEFKPYDTALRCPLLLGTDSRGITRALTISDGQFDLVDKHDFVIKPASGVPVRHSACAPSSDTDFVFVGTEHGEVHMLNPHGKTAASQRVARLAAHARRITALALSADERLLVSADETGGLVVWNRTRTGAGAPTAAAPAPTAGAGAQAAPPAASSDAAALGEIGQSLCPVCTRPVPNDRMLSHVEECLAASGM